MRGILLIVLFLLAGCRNVVGPFDAQRPIRVDDPRLEIAEQEALGRQRLAWPDETVFGNPRSTQTPPVVTDPYR